MTFVQYEPTTEPLRPGDIGYYLVDGTRIVPRAMLGINHNCPQSVRDTLNMAIDRGWVVPVANVYKHEQTFNLLSGKA